MELERADNEGLLEIVDEPVAVELEGNPDTSIQVMKMEGVEITGTVFTEGQGVRELLRVMKTILIGVYRICTRNKSCYKLRAVT